MHNPDNCHSQRHYHSQIIIHILLKAQIRHLRQPLFTHQLSTQQGWSWRPDVAPSMWHGSMIVRSCLDNVVNAHVRSAAEIPPSASALTIHRGDGADNVGRRGASFPRLSRWHGPVRLHSSGPNTSSPHPRCRRGKTALLGRGRR